MNNNQLTIVYYATVPSNFSVDSVGYTPRDEQIANDNGTKKVLRQYAWIVLTEAIAAFSKAKGYKSSVPTLLPNGKWIASDCYLSLSHTDGYVAAAVSELPVGVDIERTTRKLPSGLFERIACGKEKFLYRQPNNLQLLELWTAKEAVFKQTDDNDGLTVSQIDTSLHRIQIVKTADVVLTVATDCAEVIIKQI